MSFARPTLTDLVGRIAGDLDARLPGADSRLRRSTLAVLARVEAGAVNGLYGYLDWLARQLMPDTAEAEYLERWATIWGVPRKPATAAAGVLTVTGLPGSIVPQGSQFARLDGAVFAATADVPLLGTAVSVPVEASAAGTAGTTAAGSQLTAITPIAGVQAVAIAAGGLGGAADEETDAELLARLLVRIRTPPQGGSRADWLGWTLAVAGVTRAWIYADWQGPGTVGVTFVCDDRADIIPTAEDLATVADYVEQRRPVTARPVIFAPASYPVNYSIGLTPNTADARAAVVAQLADLYAREAAPGGVISLAHSQEAISLAAGEIDHVLHAPSADAAAPAGAIPTLGAVTFT